MEQKNQPRRTGQKPVPPATMLICSTILGVCLLIAGGSISGSLNKLTAAVKEQTFAYQSVPASAITVNNTAPKNYYNENEAAAYLNISADEIKAAISKGEIDEYIRTSSGYSISQSALDSYFEDKAYALSLENNSDEG